MLLADHEFMSSRKSLRLGRIIKATHIMAARDTVEQTTNLHLFFLQLSQPFVLSAAIDSVLFFAGSFIIIIVKHESSSERDGILPESI